MTEQTREEYLKEELKKEQLKNKWAEYERKEKKWTVSLPPMTLYGSDEDEALEIWDGMVQLKCEDKDWDD